MDLTSKNPFANAKVAVIGDVMLDTFIYGTVDRISPEAPIPVVKVTKQINRLGGAGNVAANLISLGAEPILMGRIGQDNSQTNFYKICAQKGITTDFLVTSAEATTCKTRIIAQNQQLVRFDEETADKISEKTRNGLLENLRKVRKTSDVIIVSDYAKGVIDQPMLEEIKQIWQDGEVIVDPKPRANIDYKGVTAITPNLLEAKLLLGCDHVARDNNEAEIMAQNMLEKFDLKHLFFTRSGDGITLHDGKQIQHFPTQAQEIRDVSGAGDTVISVLAAGIAQGLSLQQVAKMANIAGKIVVSKLGTASLTWEEMAREMKQPIPQKQL